MSRYKYKMVIEVFSNNEEDLQYVDDQATDAVDTISSCSDIYMETTIVEEEA